MKATTAIVAALAGGFALVSTPLSTALAATPGLVVDAASGKVLFAERATDPWYPASITKLMTTYVALDLVRQRRISMSSLLTMSPYAASQPPSKIGLKPGLTMTLENALKIIMVKSANDIATMIGENLGGGSVETFADMMNDASRRLGMMESRWVNPSGLPDSRQQTSARDMAILARALINDFPDQEHLFRIGAVKLGAKVMRNHNGLLGRYPGIDGMKTGFICSGGFNIVATSNQGGTRLIAVVMGYPSARERDLRTADLLDMGFGKPAWTAPQLSDLPHSALMSPPDMRPIVCGKQRLPSEDDEVVAAASGGTGDNPIAAFFTSTAMADPGAPIPVLGSRRDFGPRVAFAPIPVFIGPRSDRPGDQDLDKAASRLAGGTTIRAKRLGRGAPAETPTTARAFAAEASDDAPASAGKPLPLGALRASTGPDGVAGRTRPNLGGIPVTGRLMVPQNIEGTNPSSAAPSQAAKPAPKAKTAAVPAKVQVKTPAKVPSPVPPRGVKADAKKQEAGKKDAAVKPAPKKKASAEAKAQ